MTLEFFDERGAPAALHTPQGAPHSPGPLEIPRPDPTVSAKTFGTCTRPAPPSQPN